MSKQPPPQPESEWRSFSEIIAYLRPPKEVPAPSSSGPLPITKGPSARFQLSSVADSVVFYNVEVVYGDLQCAFVARFSEVVEFIKRLEASLPLANQLPPFSLNNTTSRLSSIKLIEKGTSPAFIESRIRELNEFFMLLWFVPGLPFSAELINFLHLSGPLKEIGRTPREENVVRIHFGEEHEAEAKAPEAFYENFPVQPPTEFDVQLVDAKTLVRVGYPHVTYYTVRTTSPNKPDATVERRFDDFKSLNAAVRYNYATSRSSHLVRNLPVFPMSSYKIFTDHSDPTFVENRRQALEKYIAALLAVPHARGDVHVLYFLGLWTHFRPVVGMLSGVY